ncbi:J domain-containing protein [Dokdonella soli]|uniref:J domain-containing protein n=1 Tax=Dokdonella soli TaxID=529810 RepID=A0ABN1IG69_9GAMM
MSYGPEFAVRFFPQGEESMGRTHYDNLQVSPSAGAEVIRASYRALIQKYHPDRMGGDRERGERIAKILNEAYAVLGDPISRQQYDERLRAALRSAAAQQKTSPASPPNQTEAPSNVREKSPESVRPSPPINESTNGRRLLRHLTLRNALVAFPIVLAIWGTVLETLDPHHAPSEPLPRSSAPVAPVPAPPPSPLLPKAPSFAQPPQETPTTPTAALKEKAAPTTIYTTQVPENLKPGVKVKKISTLTDPHTGKTATLYRITAPPDSEASVPLLIEQRFKTGVLRINTSKPAIAPFKITLPNTSYLYYLKLVSPSNKKKAIVAIGARGGQTLRVDVPLGTYRLRYTYGETWYGDKDIFGPGRPAAEEDADLEFTREGDMVRGHEITSSNSETEISPSRSLRLMISSQA